MKKLLALTLALLMALSLTVASAQTVCTEVTVDRELARELLPGFGVPEEQLGMIDSVLAVVNALGVRVTTVADGAQVDLSLNDEDALSVGVALDEAGAAVVSTLFPNYYLTISNETISSMMEQFAANMPGAGSGEGAGGMDVNALQEVFGGYIQEWMEACSAAGHAGEPESVEFEIDGMTFDTLVPVTVDMPAIQEATQNLLDKLLADETAMSMLKGMMQSASQSSGQTFNEETFEADFKAGFEEWMAHFPETVTAEVYVNDGDESGAFYMTAESFNDGEEEPFFTADMLYQDAAHMDMGFEMEITDEESSETVNMAAGFAMDGQDMQMYFEMAGMYFGLNISFPENDVVLEVFFMNSEKPLATIYIELTDDGDRTLSVDAEGKTALAAEDIMANGNSEAAQGLYADVMNNGLGALMGVAMEQVPEIGSLMGMAG